MERLAWIAGGLLTLIGLLGILVKLFPPYDGELAVAGAVIFASGVIANAISRQQQK